MALPRGAMGLSAVVIMVFPDHTHLLFSIMCSLIRDYANQSYNLKSFDHTYLSFRKLNLKERCLNTNLISINFHISD